MVPGQLQDPASPRLVGPERARNSMLHARVGGHSGSFNRTSQEACEPVGAGGGSGTSPTGLGSSPKSRGEVDPPWGLGAGAPSPKSAMLCSVTERLREMSCDGRPPTPVGTQSDAGAALAHLAPSRRAPSRFASPSRTDGPSSRKQSYSGAYACLPIGSHQQQQVAASGSFRVRPSSPMPHDLEASSGSLTHRIQFPNISPSRAGYHDSSHSALATSQHLGTLNRQSSSGAKCSLTPSSIPTARATCQESAPLPLLPVFQHWEGPAHGAAVVDTTAAAPHTARLKRRPSNLGPSPADKTSTLSSAAPYSQPLPSPLMPNPQDVQAEARSPLWGPHKSNGYTVGDQELAQPGHGQEATASCVSPRATSFTLSHRRSLSKHLPTIFDNDDILRRVPRASVERVRPPSLDCSHPSIPAVRPLDCRLPGQDAADSLSSWMQSRPG